MTCRDFLDLIQERWDQRAFDLDGPEFESHARSCPDCHTTLDQYRRLARELALLVSPAPPDGLADRVLEAAHRIGVPASGAMERTGRRAAPRSRRRSRPLAWAVLSLSAAALLGLAVSPFLHHPRSVPDGPSRDSQAELDLQASPPGVDESIRQASEAVWDLARHTANSVQWTGSVLIASTTPPSRKLLAPPKNSAPATTPTVAKGNVRAKPLAIAARDAFGYLWQDEESWPEENGGS